MKGTQLKSLTTPKINSRLSLHLEQKNPQIQAGQSPLFQRVLGKYFSVGGRGLSITKVFSSHFISDSQRQEIKHISGHLTPAEREEQKLTVRNRSFWAELSRIDPGAVGDNQGIMYMN